MKKLFTVLSVLFVLGTANVFATGIGAQFNANVAGNTFQPGASLTFKINKVPCVFAADLAFGSEYFNAGLSADWWLANPKIEGTWGYFYGIGVGGAAYFVNGNYGFFAVGPRAVIGTNVYVLKGALEFYAQGAWQPLVVISDTVRFSLNNFPIAVGFRFWF